jgi:Caspase domain
MARLYGAQRMVLQAIQDAQGETSAFIEDARITQATQVGLRDMRDWLLTLDQDGYVDLALTDGGLKASVTPQGRLALGLYRPFPTQAACSPPEPARSRGRTGRERALVVGISDYPPPIPELPAVANDVREIAKLLKSAQGQFPDDTVRELIDQAANKDAVLRELERTFSGVGADDAVFAYLAGHGTVVEDDYFFVAQDTRPDQPAATGVPLKKIKELFDGSPSQRAFLWLDFCHSGGILARNLEGQPDDREVIERTLKLSQGQGKLILAACTSSQLSYESTALGHGLFTDALLRGLEGEAAKDGEVTINSLFDFIDRQMGSDRQRPMMFGQITGRVVLMHQRTS